MLKRYRPHLYITAGTPPPLRFYDDYIAQGRLIGEDGTVLSGAVTPALLNLHKEEPRTVFEHLPAAGPTAPVMYGRVDHESFDLGGTKRHFTFLTWSAVFRTSGIAASISWWKGAVLGAVGNLTDWHQLDHYTAVTLALDEMQKPVAVMYQQHNYRQTQIFGIDLPWPADRRIGVDVAMRSNEFYPHKAERTHHRAASFLSPDTVAYLVTGQDRPFRVADDITDPAVDVDYELRFLPPADAFYTFKGFLGEKRLLPGRSGPPGADYNTLPAYKPLHRQMIAFHWRDGDADYVKWFGQPERGMDDLTSRFARLLEGRN